MGFLQNQWVGYLQRSAEQILSSLNGTLQSKVPEMTDLSPNNIYVRNNEIFAATNENLNYYIDNQGRESHIDSARLFKSGISHSKLADYQVIGNLGYSTNVIFQINMVHGANIIIPAGTIVEGEDRPYVTQSNATVLAGQLVSNSVSAVQYEVVNGQNMGFLTGQPNEELVFEEKIMHNSLVLTIGGIGWSSQETLAFSLPTDKHFVQNVNKTGRVVAQFGNANPSGLIPPTNQTVLASYRLTLGINGFVAAGGIDTIVTNLTLPVGITATVTNPESASGGADFESLNQMKQHIPYAFRTLRRAVTRPDYKAVTEMAAGVALAGVSFKCGKTVDIYIVPDGGGIASGALIGTTQTYIDARKMITTQVRIFAAGEVHIILKVEVTANASYFNADVQLRVEQALQDWLSFQNQQITGVVYLSDLYEKIEAVEGVEHSIIQYWYARPYARLLNLTTLPLVWTRNIMSASNTTQVWSIVFINNTDFHLVKGNVLMGTFSTGVLVAQPEIEFTIAAGAYSNGDSYQFFTYPYNPTSIALTEPSLPMSDVTDLTVNVSGGL